jgi:histidinol phosphatase-like PHP family hydrolase
MKVRWDWHIHSHHSPCGNRECTLDRILRGTREAGLEYAGVTDHLNCRRNEPAVLACRQEFDALPDKSGFHFAVELTCIRRWDLEENERLGEKGSIYGFQSGGPADGELTVHLPDEVRERVRPEYVIAGAHSTLGAPVERQALIRQQHRQHMFLATHPLVDILAHPFWWNGPGHDEKGDYAGLPWFDDMGVIPRSMHNELAAASRENGVAIEINPGGIFMNPHYSDAFKHQYWEFLALMKDAGVKFSFASDSHSAGYEGRLSQIQEGLDGLRLRKSDVWLPRKKGGKKL